MIAWIEWLIALPGSFRQNFVRRLLRQDDEWVDEIVATVGQELAATVVPSTLFRPRVVHRRPDGRMLSVEAWTVLQHGQDTALRVRVEVTTRSPVTFGARSALSGRRQPSGDELFDEHVAVGGAPGRWFGHRARRAMERVVHHGGWCANGRVGVETGGREFVGAAEVLDVARAALEAAEQLEADRGLAEDVVTGDRDPAARVTALRHLVATEPDPERARRFAADPDARVAAVAARALGPEGHARLRELLGTDGALDALAGLAESVPPGDPDVDRALLQLLTAPSREVVALAGRLGGVSVVAALLRVGGEHKEGARAAVRAIQARLAGERGGVSLGSEPVGGQLAEASADGRLSTTNDPEGPVR